MKIVVLHAGGTDELENVKRFKQKDDEHSTVVVELAEGETRSFTSAVVVTGTMVAKDEISAGKEDER